MGPLLWTADDWIYVEQVGAYTQIPTRISRFHLESGQIAEWKVRPSDSLGVNAITKVMVSQDGGTVAFYYRRALSELFVPLDHRLAITTGQVVEGPTMTPGQSFRARFNSTGQYDVVCRIHAGMRATVIVEP